jgi:hypothetical protein
VKAIITSCGEKTTPLCKWSLERNGFDVLLLMDPQTSLWSKLKWIYENVDEDFLRVDADVVPNRNCTERNIYEYLPSTSWWLQFQTFDWFKQDLAYGGVQFISKKALPALRENIDRFELAERPESQMFRLDEFAEGLVDLKWRPRRCTSSNLIVGVHGYGQYPRDFTRVQETKKRRKYYSDYDWELYDKLQQLEGNNHAA